MISVIKRLLRIYVGVGIVYGLWAFTFLQFRECGLLGAYTCYWNYSQDFAQGETILSIVFSVIPPVVVWSVLIGFGRALFWLPNLIASVLQSSFMDWLLLRDVAPMADFLGLLEKILP